MKVLVPVVTGIVLVGLAVWFLLVGGIVQIIDGATAHPVDATGIAVGAVRVLLTSLGIWAGVVIAGVLGIALND